MTLDVSNWQQIQKQLVQQKCTQYKTTSDLIPRSKPIQTEGNIINIFAYVQVNPYAYSRTRIR